MERENLEFALGEMIKIRNFHLAINKPKMMLKTITFYTSMKKNKIEINLGKENYKSCSLKTTKCYWKQWNLLNGNSSLFVDWKINTAKMASSSWSTYSMQSYLESWGLVCLFVCLFFSEIGKLILKFRRPRILKALKKITKLEDSHLSVSEYKVIIIKTVWYSHQDRHMDL